MLSASANFVRKRLNWKNIDLNLQVNLSKTKLKKNCYNG